MGPGAPGPGDTGRGSDGSGDTGRGSDGSGDTGRGSDGPGDTSRGSDGSGEDERLSPHGRTALPPLAEQCPEAASTPLYHAPGDGRTVALTFDDGPGPYTGQVLAALRAGQVHATFFVVGSHVATDPALVTRAAAEGHLIGNHTWDHVYPQNLPHGWTTSYLTDQIGRTDSAVVSATGLPTCFFRPPGGFMPPAVTVVGRRVREQVALWSIDPRDWAVQGRVPVDPATTAHQAHRIYTAARAGRDDPHPVILLHDGGGFRGATVAALPWIIAYYRAEGYRFVRLDGSS